MSAHAATPASNVRLLFYYSCDHYLIMTLCSCDPPLERKTVSNIAQFTINLSDQKKPAWTLSFNSQASFNPLAWVIATSTPRLQAGLNGTGLAAYISTQRIPGAPSHRAAPSSASKLKELNFAGSTLYDRRDLPIIAKATFSTWPRNAYNFLQKTMCAILPALPSSQLPAQRAGFNHTAATSRTSTRARECIAVPLLRPFGGGCYLAHWLRAAC
jgi:hypothetical protein